MITETGVLRMLRVGPATATEVALNLGGNVKVASAVLHNLMGKGLVHAKPFHAPPGQSQAPRLLYGLPEHKL